MCSNNLFGNTDVREMYSPWRSLQENVFKESLVWWCVSIPSLGRLWQEDEEFKASLSYRVYLVRMKWWAGETAQALRAFNALAKDPGSQHDLVYRSVNGVCKRESGDVGARDAKNRNKWVFLIKDRVSSLVYWKATMGIHSMGSAAGDT